MYVKESESRRQRPHGAGVCVYVCVIAYVCVYVAEREGESRRRRPHALVEALMIQLALECDESLKCDKSVGS